MISLNSDTSISAAFEAFTFEQTNSVIVWDSEQGENLDFIVTNDFVNLILDIAQKFVEKKEIQFSDLLEEIKINDEESNDKKFEDKILSQEIPIPDLKQLFSYFNMSDLIMNQKTVLH